MNKIIQKLFINNAWTVGIRKIDRNTLIPTDDNETVKYMTLKIRDRYYFADPFVVEDGDNVWLFVEEMDRMRGIGTIAVSKFENNKFGKFTEIICEPFHLSYPNVFRYNESYYMIPESSANNEIRFYKAVDFPYKWQYEKSLLEGKPYVDTSIILNGDKLEMFTYYIDRDDQGISEKYVYDFSTDRIEKIEDMTLINERPAGNPIVLKGEIFCPLQDCSDYYGKGIILTKLEGKEETKESYLSAKSYEMAPNVKNVTGTHTINRSANFEVIDVRFDKLCLMKQFIKLINKSFGRFVK